MVDFKTIQKFALSGSSYIKYLYQVVVRSSRTFVEYKKRWKEKLRRTIFGQERILSGMFDFEKKYDAWHHHMAPS